MSAPHDLTALDQAAAIRAGQLSPTELVDHYLDRISRYGEIVGAFVTVTAEAARERAAEAERALATGDPLPPLHGVPIAVKDLNLTAGVRTTLGSAVFAEFVPPIDDFVVTLIRQAGTISLGKTTTPEFGLPCYTEPIGAAPARTPYDLSRSAGGSSGGAGAAVAAGLVPFAQGSDGGGSIRIPASACGLYGIKPSRGRVSNGPVVGDVSGLAVAGPLARTVRDAAALLDAMAVPMPGDPYWAPPLPPGQTFLAAADAEPGTLRIGRYAEPVLAGAPIDPECLAAWERASELLVSLGHDVEDVPSPFAANVVPWFETLWAVSSYSAPVDPSRLDELTPLTRWWRDRAAGISAVEYTTAVAAIQRASRQAIVATAPYDAVLTPTLAMPPRPIGWFTEGGDPAEDFARQKRFTPFTAVYNVTGQPAVSLPLHWTEEGLPIGVMLAGRPADEATLISLSAQIEAAAPWADRHPPIW